VRKAFELFDKDKSGDIDTRELRPALRQLGLEGATP
jgi:Ca2+-binding EF-hand superfamily protein